MKYQILFLCILSFFFHSCKKDNVEPDPNGEPSNDQTFTEAVIGADGGKLETEDFILIVPEGAYDKTNTLRLYLEETDPSSGMEKVTDTYRLTGLCSKWSIPLEIKIRYEGIVEEESYIALGHKYYVPELEDSLLFNELLAAVDSQGFLTSTLPPLEVENSSLKSAPYPTPYDHPIVFHGYLMIRGWSKIASVGSECAEIKYNPGLNFDRSKVEQFARDLNDAVDFFDKMGFMDKQIFQKDRKIRVNIFNEPPKVSNPFFFEPQFEPMEGFEDASPNSI